MIHSRFGCYTKLWKCFTVTERTTRTLIILATACWMAGCGEQPKAAVVRPTRPESAEIAEADPKPVGKTADSETKLSETAAQAAKSVELIEANWSELQALVAAQQGKVVVVDVWSTSCEPCLKEFPNLIELQKRYPNEIVAISYDVDFIGRPNKPPSFYRERVLEFLQTQPENKVLHRMATTAADDLFTQIDLVSIPAIYVYDKSGKLAKRFDGVDSQGRELSYETHVTPLVDTLVK